MRSLRDLRGRDGRAGGGPARGRGAGRAATPFVEVSERAIAAAVGAFAAAGIRVEGSAAAALAALGQVGGADGPVVLIVTGRNIDPELHGRAVKDPQSFSD